MPLVHHELCFGCGRTNLFGLLLEADAVADGSLTARCFIKQDHQGAEPGAAHDGILAAALGEAMALACGLDARSRAIEVEYLGSAPVGAFLEIDAHVDTAGDGLFAATAQASSGGRTVARSRGTYRRG